MPRYCICRSKSGNGFMIACERCEEWFHGKCVQISKIESKKIEKYYCKACRESINGLEIEYKAGCEPILTIEKNPVTNITLERIEDKKPEKKVLEKIQPSSSKPKPINIKPSKIQNQSKKRVYQRTKSKSHARKQCSNPECIYESRQDSKYCSDECGYNFNKLRYEQFFIPKWRELEQKHSIAKQLKYTEIEKLEDEKKQVGELIRNLKIEKEQLEKNIKIVKEIATKLAKERIDSKKDSDEEDDESNEDVEEAATGDALKTYCITCGMTLMPTQTLKHWFSCHRKQEDCYNFTADAVFQHSCQEDENPKLYCHHQDKKTKRYCMHLESACPQHSNWSSNKDEVCGCPQNVMQKLDPDQSGGYCLELKKDCTQHYHWDKFRLAEMNMQRIQAFTRYDHISDKIRIADTNYLDTYGGVVGVMLHNTIDHMVSKEGRSSESPNDIVGDADSDTEMTIN